MIQSSTLVANLSHSHTHLGWHHDNAFHINGPLCQESTSHQWFPSKWVSNAPLWCFICCQTELAVEQRVQLLVIWDVTMIMPHYCNGSPQVLRDAYCHSPRKLLSIATADILSLPNLWSIDAKLWNGDRTLLSSNCLQLARCGRLIPVPNILMQLTHWGWDKMVTI